MLRSRRVFGKEFNEKVVLEALKEKETLEEAIKNISLVFNQEKKLIRNKK